MTLIKDSSYLILDNGNLICGDISYFLTWNENFPILYCDIRAYIIPVSVDIYRNICWHLSLSRRIYKIYNLRKIRKNEEFEKSMYADIALADGGSM